MSDKAYRKKYYEQNKDKLKQYQRDRYAELKAKNIVAAGLAEKCEVQVAYAIGVPEPLSVNVDTYGTGELESDADLEAIVRKVFDLTPAGLVATLGLKEPQGWKYQDTAAYGHFGREQFSWEKTDKIEELKATAKSI